MSRLIRFGISVLLISASSLTVLLWLALLGVSGGLMPWTAAGVLLYGWVALAIAAFFGIPGIVLARSLNRDESFKFRLAAKTGAAIGSFLLLAGVVAWGTAMIWEYIDSKNRPGPCISWRDPDVPISAGEDTLPNCGQQSGDID